MKKILKETIVIEVDVEDFEELTHITSGNEKTTYFTELQFEEKFGDFFKHITSYNTYSLDFAIQLIPSIAYVPFIYKGMTYIENEFCSITFEASFVEELVGGEKYHTYVFYTFTHSDNIEDINQEYAFTISRIRYKTTE